MLASSRSLSLSLITSCLTTLISRNNTIALLYLWWKNVANVQLVILICSQRQLLLIYWLHFREVTVAAFVTCNAWIVDRDVRSLYFYAFISGSLETQRFPVAALFNQYIDFLPAVLCFHVAPSICSFLVQSLFCSLFGEQCDYFISNTCYLSDIVMLFSAEAE